MALKTTSSSNAAWETPGIWSTSSLPGSGDDAVLLTGASVFASATEIMNSVTIGAGATATIGGGVQFQATTGLTLNGTLRVAGKLQNTAVLVLSGSAVLDVSGGAFVGSSRVAVGPGGRLAIVQTSPTWIGSVGFIQVTSGTLDLTRYQAPSVVNVVMADNAARVVVNGASGGNVYGFRAGDVIDFTAGPSGGAATKPVASTRSDGTVTIAAGGVAYTLYGESANATYSSAPDGSGGYLLTTTANATVPASAVAVPAAVPIVITPVTITPSIISPGNTAPTPIVQPIATPGTPTPPTPIPVATPAAATTPSGSTSPAASANDNTATPVGSSTTAAPYGVVAFADATSHTSGLIALDAASAGGPSYLQAQYIYAGSDDLALSTQQANVFLHSGGGNDAIQVASGQNVLDGGLGSNFLTGGSGQDTFFTDSRSAGVVWNTVRNFHAGDAATLWGFTAGVSSYRWDDAVAGASGSQGATLRANIVGGSGRSGDGIDASITFSGWSVAQAKNLQVATGTQASGGYLFLYAGA